MGNYKQSSFIGGLNRQFDPTKIADNEYPLLFNGRVREDQVVPVNLPEEITLGLPEGNIFQGIYSVGVYLVAFIDGKAYYRSFDTNATDDFKQIPGFLMSTTADRIYLELVPGATLNFKRQLEGTNANGTINLTDYVGGSPDCAVVCDGINQDMLIFPNATSRVSKTYEEWADTNNGFDREYLPLGTFPCFSDGILYKAGADPSSGRLNRILRSVTGRPIDFMVVVDTLGNKKPSKLEGDANVVSHRTDFNSITSINKIALVENPQNTQSTSPPILVGTSYNSYLVTPNKDKTIFNEPTFNQRFLFSTSPLNPFCVIDAIGGDTLIIDAKGVISFNAALFAKYEGRNLPFSRKVYPLFNGITQTVACCSKLDNYIYFGVNTIYGPGIVVYDEITQQWVSIDIYPGVNLIKQFAVISTTNVKRLFFITVDNKLYEAFASTSSATCRIYLGEWFEEFNQGVLNLNAVFRDIYNDGKAAATLYADGQEINTVSLPLYTNKQVSSIPQVIPFGDSGQDTSDDKTFGFENAPLAHKFGILLEWNAKATLSSASLDTKQHSPKVNPSQDAIIEREGTTLSDPYTIVLVGWAGINGTTLDNLVTKIKSLNPSHIVLLGNQNQPSGSQATLQANVNYYWQHQDGMISAVLGSDDILTNSGQAHLNYFDGGRYYKKALTSDVELYILNSNATEPDGISSTSNQAKWLKQQLANSSAKWKIICSFDNLDWPFRRWGASLVFKAINRNYEKLFNNQSFTFNVGSGSCNGFDSFTTPYATGSQYRDAETSGFVLLSIDDINLNGKFMSVDGTIKDKFQLLG